MIKNLNLENAISCPFCGKRDFISITDKATYKQLVRENGTAAIRLDCNRCNASLFNFNETMEYSEKVNELISAWNSRAGV